MAFKSPYQDAAAALDKLSPDLGQAALTESGLVVSATGEDEKEKITNALIVLLSFAKSLNVDALGLLHDRHRKEFYKKA